MRIAFALWFALSVYAQHPSKVDFKCKADVFQDLGINCTPEDPCPIYLELSAVDLAAGRIFVSGNLHTGDATLSSILLMSEDAGATWTEPQARIPAAGIDQIQFVDAENGWISGELLQGKPHDPFLLITHDSGKTWQSHPLSAEHRMGLIDRFWFDSKDTGLLVLDRTQPDENGTRYELYESHTGGDSWSMREAKGDPIKLKVPEQHSDYRLRPDAASKTYHLERRQGERWALVASFPIRVAECKSIDTAQ